MICRDNADTVDRLADAAGEATDSAAVPSAKGIADLLETTSGIVQRRPSIVTDLFKNLFSGDE